MSGQIFFLLAILSFASGIPIEKWHKSSDGCPYYIERQQNFNWYQSMEECLNKNLSLLAIESLYEQEQIDALIKRVFGENITYWMAGSDNAADQRYVWATTGKIFSFTNWASGNPTHQTNEHCIFVNKHTNQWQDTSCVTKYGFICEDQQCGQDKNSEFQVKWWKDPKNFNLTILNVHGGQ